MEIRAGSGLGAIGLGDSLWDVLQLVRADRVCYAGGLSIAREDGRQRDEADGSRSDCGRIIVTTLRDSLRLVFSSLGQDLLLIEVLDVSQLGLVYQGHEIQSECSQKRLTFRTVYRRFGPTRAGDWNAGAGTFVLSYPGIAFTFLSETEPTLKKMLDMQASAPVACMAIFRGRGWAEALPHLDRAAAAFATSERPSELLRVTVPWPAGPRTITFEFGDSKLPRPRHHTLRIGESTAQSVALLLGPPDDTMHKSDTRFSIYAAQRRGRGGAPAASTFQPEEDCYFWNYYAYGLDVMFDSTTHRLRKVKLHTNQLECPTFNVYRRCPFALHVDMHDDCDGAYDERIAVSPITLFSSVQPVFGAAEPIFVGQEGGRAGLPSPSSSYEDILADDTDVRHSRAGGDSDDDGDSDSDSSGGNSRLGTSTLFAYRDLVFEVLGNDLIANVTVFSSAV